jgi:KaiC/GvpD/RAD55 family RecA-like ATPase
VAANYEEAVARIDMAAMRRRAQMLVDGEDLADDVDPKLVMNVTELDGKGLVTEFRRKSENYSTTPFDPNGDRLRLYPGGVTVWSGFPGAGKTTLLRQLACHLLQRKEGVFFASLEEVPQDLMVRLGGIAAGCEIPSAHQMQWFLDEYGDRFRIWAEVGIAQHRKLLAAIKKLAKQGIRHAVIDSLMCLDIDNGDFEAQRKFANMLAQTARASAVHIHLVAHPRKLVNSQQEPDLNDVAGAREIGGIADNVLFVRRSVNEPPQAGSTPMCIAIRKQRHGWGGLGDVTGYFHRKFRQFHTTQFQDYPTRYLPADAYVPYGEGGA